MSTGRTLCHAPHTACLTLALALHGARSYKAEYGPDKDKFSFSLFLVLVQCVANGLVGLLGMLISRNALHASPCVRIHLRKWPPADSQTATQSRADMNDSL